MAVGLEVELKLVFLAFHHAIWCGECALSPVHCPLERFATINGEWDCHESDCGLVSSGHLDDRGRRETGDAESLA